MYHCLCLFACSSLVMLPSLTAACRVTTTCTGLASICALSRCFDLTISVACASWWFLLLEHFKRAECASINSDRYVWFFENSLWSWLSKACFTKSQCLSLVAVCLQARAILVESPRAPNLTLVFGELSAELMGTATGWLATFDWKHVVDGASPKSTAPLSRIWSSLQVKSDWSYDSCVLAVGGPAWCHL